MRKIIILFFVLLPLVSEAQQLKVYTDSNGYNYFALYAYGLPREVVKTNQEIKDSKYGDSGIMRRHHTTKYDDEAIGSEGYNCNEKLSFAFVIAPYNVDAEGNELLDNDYQEAISWYAASGWSQSIDTESTTDAWGQPILVNNLSEASIVNESPTGCAAYKGPLDLDEPGTWRLPTQRELLMMFTIIEQALTLGSDSGVTSTIVNGEYWTSTEMKTSSNWKVWYVDNTTGIVVHHEKVNAWGLENTAYARCVRDIDDDPIND